MKRAELKKIARKIGAEVQAKGYDHWFTLDMADDTITFERQINGQNIFVDLCRLERNAEYVRMGISVEDKMQISFPFPLSILLNIPMAILHAFLTGGISVVVRKAEVSS